jgi:RNA polymerase sigma factor (sigma-70 family)
LLLPSLTAYVNEIGRDMSPAEREMIIEKAVLRAADRIDLYDSGRASFVGWVRGFVRYATADARRAKGGTVEILDGVSHAEIVDNWAPPQEEDDHASPLTWVLLELPLPDQVIIALRDFEGLNYRECAARIGGGVTEGACRVRHLRARRRLKSILQEKASTEGRDQN